MPRLILNQQHLNILRSKEAVQLNYEERTTLTMY